MQTQAPGQFPYSLDWIEVRTIGRQERQLKVWLLFLTPLDVQGCVMIFGVINDHHDAPSSPAAGLAHLLQEGPSGLCVDSVRLTGEHELPIAKPHRAKIPHALASGMMEQHGILDLGWYPHSAARTMLLEMHFVHGPQINRLVVYQLVEFFYRRPVVAGRLRQPPGAAFATGNSTAGTDADIAS
jgi:hypothetical protein